MWTNYQYNSLNQLTEQTTPDGGTSRFYYDKLGRLVASQNAEQKLRGKQLFPEKFIYSYTDFDRLGRITEVGEVESQVELTDDIARGKDKSLSWRDWLYPVSIPFGTKHEVVRTFYDKPIQFAVTQENLRNRIASVTYDYDGDGNYESASHYDYDINGNVQKLVQENRSMHYGGNELKTIRYQYDLVSGNVHQVDYQLNSPNERFSHRYEYDADNRLTVAYTSRNGVIWEKESKNFYYLHGPLARTEIGDKQVQAQDYAYTLQGWLKSVNSSTGNRKNDMGKDGINRAGNLNSFGAKDAYGFSLHYYKGDYSEIGSGANPNSIIKEVSNAQFDQESPDLFNGNISKMIVGLTDHHEKEVAVIGNAYHYDQLNRIRQYNAYINGNNDKARADNNFAAVSNHQSYKSDYHYDGNGNIERLDRNGVYVAGVSTLAMDEFSYVYDLTLGHKRDNKLYQVEDAAIENYATDLNSQGVGNYEYDALGRLVKDVKEGIVNPTNPAKPAIYWNVANKITQLLKQNGEVISFEYDPMGNRISKSVKTAVGTTTTFYVRDAQGNVMATYTHRAVPATSETKGVSKLSLADFHIYGSARLGTKQEDVLLFKDGFFMAAPETSERILGTKRYELSNHLGNVLEVISDRKLSVADTTNPKLVSYYQSDIVSWSDYYPFGSQMIHRNGQEDEYRYGFNGMEKDDEIRNSKGNSYDYGARMLDPRIGRWLSVDKLEGKFPALSTYNFVMNNPLFFMDPDGNEPIIKYGFRVVGYRVEKGQGLTQVTEELNKAVVTNVTWQQIVEYNMNPENNPNAERIFKGIKDPSDENDPGWEKMNMNEGDILYVNPAWYGQEKVETNIPQNKIATNSKNPPVKKSLLEKLDNVFAEGSSDGANLGTPWEQGGKQQFFGTVSVVTAPIGGFFFGTLSFLNGVDDLGTNEKGESLIIQNVENESTKNTISNVKLGMSIATGIKSGVSVSSAPGTAEKVANILGAANDAASASSTVNEKL